MDEIHEAPYFGHPGYQKTIAIARKQYFWLGIKKDIVEYISKCMKCQQVTLVHVHIFPTENRCYCNTCLLL